MDFQTRRGIARLYLPSRWHYHYARSKLATDPLYEAVAGALAGADTPVLDLGCGLGLLVHYLKASGIELPYLGVDNDHGKIRLAQAAALQAKLANCRFETMDLAQGFPEHRGTVVLLDVLQFLPPASMPSLLDRAIACVGPTGRLVIRTGLQDDGWRSRVTRTADRLACTIRWMNSAPLSYPTRDFLEDQLDAAGLSAEFTPLWGNTPFNNWLVVARKA